MTDALAADKGERTDARFGYRSGYYTRRVCTPVRPVTRAGTLEPRSPQDRDGRFSTELFERYELARNRRSCRRWQRCYLQGASTREVKAVPRSCAAIPSRKRRKRCQ